MRTATRTLLNPTTEPTERSIPAEIITMVIPMATTPMIATWRTRFERLLRVRKLGEVKERMTKKASRMRMRIPSAKPVRKNFTILDNRETERFGSLGPLLTLLTAYLQGRHRQCPRLAVRSFPLQTRL